MSNNNYIAGRAVEYACQRYWEVEGYSTIRAAGSHGLFDVVAFRFDRVVEFVQCKRVATEAAAKRLLKAFKECPPLKPSAHFHQTIWVKVKGSKDILTGTV